MFLGKFELNVAELAASRTACYLAGVLWVYVERNYRQANGSLPSFWWPSVLENIKLYS